MERRQRVPKSARATRRSRHIVQRGGAAWVDMKTKIGPRWADWEAKLKSNPLFTALFDDTADDAAKGTAWLNCIAEQEKLFETALEIIKEKLGADMLKPDFSNAADVDAKKATYMPYITDVERFIQFVEDTPTAGNLTKLQTLNTNESLSKILLFPGCLTNTFMTSLAGIIVSLKKDPATLETAKNSAEVQRLLADQYKSIAYTNSYYLTAAAPRDGFFLNQGVADFKRKVETENLFLTFIQELARITQANVKKEDLFVRDLTAKDCKKGLRDSLKKWGFTLAHFTRYFLLEPTLDSLFAHFNDCATEPTDIDMTLVPDSILPKSTDPDKIMLDGVSVRKLMYSMGDTTFQTLLHLRARVRELSKTP